MKRLMSMAASFLMGTAGMVHAEVLTNALLDLRESWNELLRASDLAFPKADQVPTIVQAVDKATKAGDHRKVIEVLVPLLNEHPDGLATARYYKTVVNACLALGDRAAAESWARKEIAAWKATIKAHEDKPVSVVMHKAIRDAYARLPEKEAVDYENERAYHENAAKSATYTACQDLILTELCKLEYQNKHYDRVLELCDRMDEWYQSLPEIERGRLLPDRWRARALQGQGKTAEAIRLLEKAAKTARKAAPLQTDNVLYELQEMKKLLKETPGTPQPAGKTSADYRSTPNTWRKVTSIPQPASTILFGEMTGGADHVSVNRARFEKF